MMNGTFPGAELGEGFISEGEAEIIEPETEVGIISSRVRRSEGEGEGKAPLTEGLVQINETFIFLRSSMRIMNGLDEPK